MKKMKLGQKATITTLVKNLINKKTEDKHASYVIENSNAHNSYITDADVYRVCPAIPQGEESYQRLGDSIKPKYLTIKGLVSLNRNLAKDNKPIYVDVYVLTLKKVKNWTGVRTSMGTDYPHFLRINGEDGTPTRAFTGALTDFAYKVNNKLFNVLYHKRMLISGEAIPSLSSGVAAPGSVEANLSTFKRYSAKIKCPATLDFETADTAVNHPTNWAPFLCIGYGYLDGSTGDASDTRIVHTAVSDLHYTDF